MTFKHFITSILSNRFKRLAALILLYAIIFIPMLIIGLATDDTSIIFAPTVIFVICLAGQFLGDIMNVEGLFNNRFVTLLKRVAFLAVVLAASIIGSGIVLGSDWWNIMMAEGNASFLVAGIKIAPNFAGPFALCAYVFGYVMHSKRYHSPENKKWLPLFLPITYVASIVAGLVTALILILVGVDGDGMALILGLIDAALAILAVIVSIKTEVWVFEEEAVVYNTSPSRPSSINPPKNEYDRFREKCANCTHVRTCRIVENTTWGDKRNVDYCNLTGNEIYSIYSEVCPRFVDRCK